jgi:hypothetical protein
MWSATQRRLAVVSWPHSAAAISGIENVRFGTL